MGSVWHGARTQRFRTLCPLPLPGGPARRYAGDMAENTSGSGDVPERVRAIETATGLPWRTLVEAFETAGGEALTHGELAEAIHPVIAGHIDNAGWWAQGATVAYEQQIGRRVVGQSSRGDFQVSVSRTLPVGASGRPGLREAAGEAVTAAGSFGGIALEGEPRTSDTPKRLYWRCGLADGAKLQVSVEAKTGPGEERTLVTLTVTGLTSEEQREAVRADLKAVLTGL